MLTMAAKLLKWRKLSTRIDLMLRSDAVSTRRFLHEGPDTMEELLDRHLAKKRETANQRRGGGVSEQTAFYTWTDSRGVLWRDVLRENARKEFDAVRFETDPEVITRLLIGGSDAVSSALDRLTEKQREMIEKRNRGDQP
ncbi:hypothetical protein F2Q70_00016186 [Brassica cretica]|uniref:Uncharacterized protein n=1 Tax=Brassica cretica TaxID=69181 RepID=A0A8S9HYN9_BRACR|nr:hypothetical protein F2Q70_00016186 [Brassica cretica]KAF2597000.1 hypothetical protein F2Q68_00009169 [Brassica cretica]